MTAHTSIYRVSGQAARQRIALEIHLGKVRQEEKSRIDRGRMLELGPLGAGVIQHPVNDRHIGARGEIQETFRVDPCAIELDIETENTDRGVIQAAHQFRLRPL